MELVINGRDKFVLVLHFHELPNRFILECGFSLLQFLRMSNLLVGNTHQLTERNVLIVFFPLEQVNTFLLLLHHYQQFLQVNVFQDLKLSGFGLQLLQPLGLAEPVLDQLLLLA